VLIFREFSHVRKPFESKRTEAAFADKQLDYQNEETSTTRELPVVNLLRNVRASFVLIRKRGKF
jgi:hypothetical protein